jgi:hypothetical protein
MDDVVVAVMTAMMAPVMDGGHRAVMAGREARRRRRSRQVDTRR